MGSQFSRGAVMANKVGKYLGSVKGFLEKFPLAPWKIAGPLVSQEWKSADLNVEEYRLNPPGQEQKEAPAVPRTTPDRVYDIKYWPRDTKREGMLVGGTNKKFKEVTWVDVGPSVQAEQVVAQPPSVSAYRTFKVNRRPLLEVTNDGYQ